LIYLYVFTTADEVPPAALEQLQASHPQRTKRPPAVIGTRTVEEGLPESDDDFVRQTAATVCHDAGIEFDAARDEAGYGVEEADGQEYGVLAIDVQLYPRAALVAAGLVSLLVGLALGVNTLSVWLLAAGFGGFQLYLWFRGPARMGREGWLFAVGPTILMSWVAGFVFRGVVF
jgi:hypothetical protein